MPGEIPAPCLSIFALSPFCLCAVPPQPSCWYIWSSPVSNICWLLDKLEFILGWLILSQRPAAMILTCEPKSAQPKTWLSSRSSEARQTRNKSEANLWSAERLVSMPYLSVPSFIFSWHGFDFVQQKGPSPCVSDMISLWMTTWLMRFLTQWPIWHFEKIPSPLPNF